MLAIFSGNIITKNRNDETRIDTIDFLQHIYSIRHLSHTYKMRLCLFNILGLCLFYR